MQQSNTYIIIFTAIMTLVVGGLLSGASQFLAPFQKKSIELDTKSSILTAVMDISSLEKNDVLNVYDERIQSLVVDFDGNLVTTNAKGNPIVPEEVNILKNYKLDPKDRAYPVFKFMSESNPDELEAYIFPVYGNGLWDKIWGYIALESDMNTIKGVSFGHKAETPGLGQRIETPQITDRYKGKQIYDDQGTLVSVIMVKGETGNNADFDSHHVDGMSGATLTAKGVNQMLDSYLTAYQGYINKVKGQGKQL